MAEVVRAACPHDCPDTCAMLVTVEDGVATQIRGDPAAPFTDGTLCTKVAHYLERTYASDRLQYPMRRIGRKGQGQFKRITWDEALDEIAARLKALAAENPESILPCNYAGTMGMVQYMSMDRRFFYKLGASLLDRTLCSSAGKAGIKATLGGSVGMDPERFDEARLIILWGANPIVSNLHLWSRVQAAKRRGAKVVAIDPYRSLSAEKCTQHVALLPGTDGALALGMMHVLITEGLLDQDYIANHTLGFDDLRKRVLEKYSPEWAARTCGIATREVVQLAREYGTTKPAAIRLNYGMQRHTGGGIAARTIACLPALTGAWRDAAGGIVLTTADFYGFDHAALERPDLLAGRRPRVINHSKLGDALTSAEPPVRMTMVYNNNPVAVCPDSEKVIAGFAREDLFTVVMDHFQTDTADYADILLPATTQLEHHDVHKSYGHLYVLANNPAIAPVGESLPNSEVFRRLAARMGFDEACFRDSDEDICRTALKGISWDRLKQAGWQRLDVPERFAPFAQGGFPTASGKCEFYSEWLEKQGVDPLPFYNPPVEVSNEDTAKPYPLAFLSPPARNFLNSSFANVARFRELEREPHLDMHPGDAAARGIADGDMVRVFNDRGSYRLRARVNGKPRPGVVVAPSVWW
ncbi:MAG TPA: molybdopterin-dependent oxidoreductase, partial [Burkholderiales bacterium]|nr:molybdopterin-dependent oxidoreductase [Burkholderiales bacterium]